MHSFLLGLACRDPDEAPAPAPEPLPLLDEALAARCPDPSPRGPVVPPGDELHKLTLQGEGVCNDGSPALLYVRPAVDPEHARDWVVFLEGGSYCDTEEDCAIRWCGEDFYDAAYMSSRWHPETRAGIGISAPRQENAFATWNQVVLAYCSSDRWSGQRPDQELSSFRLHFMGHQIVKDALASLSSGPTSDDGELSLPPLTEARTVVLAGSSAGGLGVTTQLDRVAGALPGVEVVGVPDALFFVDPAVLDPEDAPVFEQRTREDHELHTALWGMTSDDSCLQDASEPWRCSNFTHVLRDHVSTPFLLHHDLFDTVIFESNYVPELTLPEYAQAAADTFALWQQQQRGSVLLTSCGVHQYVPDTLRFLEWTTDGWSLHDALVSWLQGARPFYVLPDVTGASSDCPGK